MKFFYIIFFSVFLLNIGCTEPFEIETVDYESVLVVESTITDETKRQIVKLSRTSTLENPGIVIENNARVTVAGSNGDSYNFSQNADTGDYISDQAFKAVANVQYTLTISTQDGKNYTSTAVTLPPTVEMENVYAERIEDLSQNKDGVQILVDTEDPTGNAQFFRYEYEETYKISAPYPSPYIAEIINYNPSTGTYEVVLTDREPEVVCYSTEYSTGINQTTTTALNENRVYRFPVKYLSRLDPKIRTRYSILVKQYVQSIEAFTFYKIVKELGSIESLLSQSQPGYVAGNITSNTNSDEKVLGFFEASSMTQKRIYFNHEDFGLETPPYFVECEPLLLDYEDATTLDDDPDERNVIYTYITYFDYQVISFSQFTLYTIVQPECSVCTYFSSNVRPDFWED